MMNVGTSWQGVQRYEENDNLSPWTHSLKSSEKLACQNPRLIISRFELLTLFITI